MNRIENFRDLLQNRNFVMLILALFFMVGILTYLNNIALLASFITTVILILLLYFRIFSIKKVIAFGLIFYVGYFLTSYRSKNYDELLTIAPSEGNIIGQVTTIPNGKHTDKLKFFLEVNEINNKKIAGKTLVTISNKNKDLTNIVNIGNTIEINGKLRKPFQSTNPSQFSYSNYLKNYGVFTTIYTDEEKIKLINNPKNLKWKMLQNLNNARLKILKVHAKYINSPYLEILGGIVFGDDAVTPSEDIRNSFIHSGLLHILAASGMNVAFIFTFWFIILKYLKIPYKPRVISGILVVILYTLMTGLGASVVRATLMLLFVLIGKLINRDAHSVALLAFVAIIMLIYNPMFINNVSFQLSFFVTLGLLTTATTLIEKIKNIKMPEIIKATVLIPLVAQIWVAPIQMFYFNTFSLYSVIANILASTVLSLISFLGFLSSIIALIPFLPDILCKWIDFILNYLLVILVYISNLFSACKHSIIQTTHPSIIQLIIYYLMLIITTIMVKLNKYKVAIITTISSLFVIFLLSITLPNNNFEIITFDVQNADAFLLKTPNNKYFMIDTGKAPYDNGTSQAQIIILKYLKDKGIKNLEGVIVTHFDNDHAGGTTELIKNLNIKNLYLTSETQNTQTAKNIFKEIKKHNTKYSIAKNNQTIYNEKNFKIKTFKTNFDKQSSENENSIITLATFNNFEILFMGDAGAETYEKLKNQIPKNIEVLKIGHHGGKGVVNEEMLKNLQPQTSIISTGTNHFGHPNKGTLDLLRKTKIYRTDFQHAIKISTNGNFYKIYTYDSRKKLFKFNEKITSKI